MSTPGTKFALATAVALAASTAAAAQTSERLPLLRDLSPEATSIAVYYKESVYDPADQKIGRIVDLVITKDGAVPAAIVSVGGLLGLASKYVAVPFPALQVRQRARKPYLILDTDKKLLREAPAFEYDRSTRRWKRIEED